jgi:hypothetical protein
MLHKQQSQGTPLIKIGALIKLHGIRCKIVYIEPGKATAEAIDNPSKRFEIAT